MARRAPRSDPRPLRHRRRRRTNRRRRSAARRRDMSRYEHDDEPYVVIEQTSGSFGSFLVGIALGAGIALLLAPDSGLETRRRLRRGARKVKRAAREKAEELAD